MSLNWTIEAILEFVTGSMLISGTIFSLKAYKRLKVKPLLFFSISFGFIAGYLIIDAFAILISSVFLAQIHTILVFPATLFLVFSVDYTSKETISLLKISITISLGALVLFFAFLPGSVTLNLDRNYPFVNAELFDLFYILMIVNLLSLFVYWGVTTRKHTPNKLKYAGNLILFGIILLGPIDMVFFIMSRVSIIFVILDYGSMTTGILILTYIMIKEPKIFYVLPFKAYHLQVNYTESGISLFNYKWTEFKSESSDDLVAGLLNAIDKMSINVLERGGVKEMRLEQGILIFQKGKYITTGLLTSKSSRVLRECLLKFTLEFEVVFKKGLEKPPSKLNQFESADELIKNNFTHIPSRI
jgi:hypothetical protein